MTEREPDDVTEEYLKLPRSLADEDRYEDAVRAYRRAISVLEGRNEPQALVTAKLECFLALLEIDALDEAGAMYHDLYRDLDRFGLTLTDFEEFMFPLMLQIAHGDTDGVLDEMQSYVNNGEEMLPLADMVSMMHLAASVHERNNSPLQAANLLMTIAETYEAAAIEHGEDVLGSAVAEAYWQHARFLARNREKCVFEAEVGYDIDPEEIGVEGWTRFLVETLDDVERGSDMDEAVRARILLSLDASDRWGPANRSMRALVGCCRVHTFIQGERHADALLEAKRVIPIAEQAGDPISAGALRAIVEVLSQDFDGPDFDDGLGFGR